MSETKDNPVSTFQKWFMGLLGVAVIGIFGQYGHWVYDEAQEGAEAKLNKEIMFDTPADKLETKNLTNAVKPAAVEIKWAKDEIAQQKILEGLEANKEANKKQDCLLTRLNDQYYQLNKKIDN